MRLRRQFLSGQSLYMLNLRHCRMKWSWIQPWEAVFGKKSPPEKAVVDSATEEGNDSSLSHMERLRSVAWAHLGKMDDDLWKKASLGSVDSKGKILCKCERKFSVKIPDQVLGTIATFRDLLQYLENYQAPKEIPRIYPLHQATELPANLSIQFISTEREPRKTRVPYDNVGVIRHQVSSRKKIRVDYNKKVRTEPSRREKIKMMRDRVWY